MREAVFVRRHSDDWEAFEKRLDAKEGVDPDELAEGYVRLTDDLAYAKTFYPGSATAAYLNGLAGEVHHRIYRNRREERGRLLRFWKEEIPSVIFREWRALFWSLMIFAGSVALGAISAASDDTFVRIIMGDAYVNMTLENIESGDPMAVYKDMFQVDMFAYIALNNILVSFYTFIGVFFMTGLVVPAFSFGTAFSLFRNGIMLGSFQYFFYEHGVFWESVRTIWIHGTLEISAIIIAGGAGLAMGNSLLFPGTYPRLTSFRRGAIRGLKIVIGLVPIFIMAALLEGFVTRYTEMPLALSLFIILGSLAFVLWYFVTLPIQVGRKHLEEDVFQTKLDLSTHTSTDVRRAN
ncbi:MAG: stage II sporulation protein M [Rubricoccaceae bacterium]|nr:stage II sporulation protein M [Rubricoccaceae bacterium]